MSGMTFNRLLAGLVIAGIAVHQHIAFRRTPGIDQYHSRVRAAAAQVPSRIGAWVGQDVPVPVRALTVLRPNVLISRRYIDIETGASAVVLLVHCADAHSMVGHFPGRCYPAEGWDLKRSTERDWMVGDLRLTGTEYEFTMDATPDGRGPQDIIVANCLLRPGGLVLRDMDSMSNSIRGADGQSTGAGQLQVVFDAGVPSELRDAEIAALASGYRPVIDAILSRPGAN
jgi:uncharacterized protein DUF3485